MHLFQFTAFIILFFHIHVEFYIQFVEWRRRREWVLFTTKTPRVDIAHDYVDTKCSIVYFEDLNMGFSLNRFYDLQNLFAFFG